MSNAAREDSACAVVRAKATARKLALAARDALTADDRALASERICEGIFALAAYQRASVVMAYSSFGSEVQTAGLLADVCARGKTLVLPRIDRAADALGLFVVRDPAGELVANAWGIREPRPEVCAPATPADIGFVLLPGVAFDTGGRRLGYGKAYYDRLLQSWMRERALPFTAAGVFEAQMLDRVPIAAHDVPVACIVTESRTIDASQSLEIGRG